MFYHRGARLNNNDKDVSLRSLMQILCMIYATNQRWFSGSETLKVSEPNPTAPPQNFAVQQHSTLSSITEYEYILPP